MITKIISKSAVERLIIPCIVALGLLGTVVISSCVVDHQKKEIKYIFHSNAQGHIALVESDLQKVSNYMNAVSSVNNLQKSMSLSMYDLIFYAKTLREKMALDNPLFIAPMLQHKDRASLEMKNALIYGGAYGIVKSYNASRTRFVPAPLQEIYYPVQFVSSSTKKNLLAVGFTDWAALNFDIKSLEKGILYVSESYKLINNKGKDSIVLVSPLFDEAIGPDRPSAIIVSTINLEVFIENALSKESPAGVDLEISEINSGNEDKLLYQYISRKNRDIYNIDEYLGQFDETSSLYTSKIVYFGDKKWKISAFPTLNSPYKISYIPSVITLVVGCILTFLMSMLVFVLLKKKERLKQAVRYNQNELACRSSLINSVASGADFRTILRQILVKISAKEPALQSVIVYKNYKQRNKLDYISLNMNSTLLERLVSEKVSYNKEGKVLLFNNISDDISNIYSEAVFDTDMEDLLREQRIYSLILQPLTSPSLGALGYIVLCVPKDYCFDRSEHNQFLTDMSNLASTAIEEAYNFNEKVDISSQFRILSEQDANKIAILDDNLCFKYVSESFANSLGYKREALLGQSYEYIVPNSVKLFVRDKLDQAKRMPQKTMSFEFEPLNEKYTQIHWSVEVSAMLTTPGVEGITLNCKDITESKGLSVELNECTKMMAMVLKSLKGAIIRLEYVNEVSMFKVLSLSEGWENLSGYSNNDYIGAHATRSLWDAIHPSDTAFVKETIMRAVVQNKSFSFNMRVVSGKDNAIASVWCQGNIRPHPRNVEHKMIDIVAMDVTEKQSVEERLQEQSSQLGELIDNIPGVVYQAHVDKRRTITFVSDYIEVLSGYPQSCFEAGNSMLSKLVFPEELDAIYGQVCAAIEGDGRLQIQYRLLTKDGSVKHVREHASIHRNSKGELLMEGVVFDVTDEVHILEEHGHLSEVSTKSDKLNSLQHLSHDIATDLEENIQPVNDLLTEARRIITSVKAKAMLEAALNLNTKALRSIKKIKQK